MTESGRSGNNVTSFKNFRLLEKQIISYKMPKKYIIN